MPLPEADCVADPAFGARTDADADAETMADAWVFAVLDFGPCTAQGANAPFHGRCRGNAIPLADDGEGRGLFSRVVGMCRIGHHDD